MYDSKRIVLIGHPRVGKTALVTQLHDKKFVESYTPTVEDVYECVVTAGVEPCDVQIFDTSGDEQWSELRHKTLQNGQGFMLCFSITDRSSFYSVRRYYADMQRAHAGEVFTAEQIGRAKRSSTVAVSPPHAHRNGHINGAAAAPSELVVGELLETDPHASSVVSLDLAHVELRPAESASNSRLHALSPMAGSGVGNGSGVRASASLPLAGLLVGLKSDLFEERSVEALEAEALAKDLNMHYVEISNRSFSQCEDAFKRIVQVCRTLNEKECACGAKAAAAAASKHDKNAHVQPCVCHDTCEQCRKRRMFHQSETHKFVEATPPEQPPAGCCVVQ